MKNAIKDLIDNIKNNPEEWSFNRYTAVNKNRRIEIWRGILFCQPYEVSGSRCFDFNNWTLLESFLVNYHLKKIPNYLIEKALKDKNA